MFGIRFLPHVEGGFILETSWLPAVPEVSGPLRKLGFRRHKSGAYRILVADAGDRLKVRRLVARAIEIMIEEAGS